MHDVQRRAPSRVVLGQAEETNQLSFEALAIWLIDMATTAV